MPSAGMLPSEGSLSSGGFPSSQPVDRSAAGLNYQSYQLTSRATGSALGRGQRVAPDPNSLFSNPPPMSGGQFGGGHAKSFATFGGEPPEGAI